MNDDCMLPTPENHTHPAITVVERGGTATLVAKINRDDGELANEARIEAGRKALNAGATIDDVIEAEVEKARRAGFQCGCWDYGHSADTVAEQMRICAAAIASGRFTTFWDGYMAGWNASASSED
jgi:hypothetical protein